MSLFRRSRPAVPKLPPVPTGPPITIDVIEDTEGFGKYWSGGYAPIHKDTDGGSHFARLGESLGEAHVLYCKVAGVDHHERTLQDARFAAGSPLMLRPEPKNRYDRNAVGVWDGSGNVQVGYIPEEFSDKVAKRMRAGEQVVGYVIREIRHDSASGRRSGLHILVLPPGELNLVVAAGMN